MRRQTRVLDHELPERGRDRALDLANRRLEPRAVERAVRARRRVGQVADEPRRATRVRRGQKRRRAPEVVRAAGAREHANRAPDEERRLRGRKLHAGRKRLERHLEPAVPLPLAAVFFGMRVGVGGVAREIRVLFERRLGVGAKRALRVARVLLAEKKRLVAPSSVVSPQPHAAFASRALDGDDPELRGGVGEDAVDAPRERLLVRGEGASAAEANERRLDAGRAGVARGGVEVVHERRAAERRRGGHHRRERLVEGGEDDGELGEGGFERRRERGDDAAQDILLQTQDGGLVRREHLAHPRRQGAAVQARGRGAALNGRRCAGERAPGREVGAGGGALAGRERLEAPERVPERDEAVEARALGRVHEGEVGGDAKPLGRRRRRGLEDDHLPGDAHQGEEDLGDHRARGGGGPPSATRACALRRASDVPTATETTTRADLKNADYRPHTRVRWVPV